MNSDTCVIIPVYNEAEVLEEVLANVKKRFANILCVDDGSTDNSAEVIRSSGVGLIGHFKNQGQGAAFRTGIQHALQNPLNRYFITFDSDGQHDVEDALKMLKHIRKSNVDIVLGSRFLNKSAGVPLTKKIVLKAAIAFSNITTGLKLSDTHNGLRTFNRKVAANLRLTCSGMAHASEIIYRVAENKFTFSELPVTITYSRYSKSKGQSVLNSLSILKEILVYRLQKEN